ncbi:DC-STAMP domain-containing protein 2-like [Paramacrobiotus metropolitanus]|uniref:DC-STAMP domain-containing protein 2-like n=1 Tax=Paramacrobiotus metropolitanus TaxID=2943436 RepID=UPI002445F520|nr:DC-STAMP domain-containing protein 2-like [Paramacrobiotus metropolitanus]
MAHNRSVALYLFYVYFFLLPRFIHASDLHHYAVKKVNYIPIKMLKRSETILEKLNPKSSQHDRIHKKPGLFTIAWAVSFVVTLCGTFTWLYFYSSRLSAVIVTSTLSGILICLSIVSPRFRITCILVVPHLGMRHGRSALLAVVMSTLLAGPINNMSRNSNSIINSTVCAGHLLTNETDKVFQRATKPYERILEKVNATGNQWNMEAKKYREELQSINAHIGAISNSIHGLKNVQSILSRIGIINTVRKSVSMFGNALDPSRIGSSRSGKERDRLEIEHQLTSSLSNLTFIQQYTERKLKNIREEVFQDVGIKSVRKNLNNLNTDFERLKNITRQLNIMVKGLKDFQTATGVIKYITAFAFLLLYFTCWRYIGKYLTSNKFDNVYVTQRVKSMYAELRQEMEGEDETKKVKLTRKQLCGLVDITSLSLSLLERAAIKSGMVIPGIYAILTIILFGCNLTLEWLISLMQYSSSAGGSITTQDGFDLKPSGKGLMADKLFPKLFEGFPSNDKYNISIEMDKCAPVLHQLKGHDYLVPVIILLSVMLLLVLDGYCLRMRQLMLTYLYPERSEERNEHLCKKLYKKKPKKIKDFLKFRQKAVERSKLARYDTENGWIFASALSKKISDLMKFNCAGCGKDIRGKTNILECSKQECHALFCKKCQKVLQAGNEQTLICVLCEEKIDRPLPAEPSACASLICCV